MIFNFRKKPWVATHAILLVGYFQKVYIWLFNNSKSFYATAQGYKLPSLDVRFNYRLFFSEDQNFIYFKNYQFLIVK